MKPTEINTDKLAVFLKKKRNSRGFREVAREIGNISAPTLSRIEQGRLPDLDTFIRLCRWLGVSPDSFLNEQYSQAVNKSEVSTPEKVEILLRAEQTLTPATIEAIVRMVNLAIDASDREQIKSAEKQ